MTRDLVPLGLLERTDTPARTAVERCLPRRRVVVSGLNLLRRRVTDHG